MYAKVNETPMQNQVYRTKSAFRQIERNFSENISQKKAQQLLQNIPNLNESKLLQSVF